MIRRRNNSARPSIPASQSSSITTDLITYFRLIVYSKSTYYASNQTVPCWLLPSDAAQDLVSISPYKPTLPVTSNASLNVEPPLCVDLDGTLLRTDSLLEGVLAMARAGDAALLQTPLWLLRGRAFLKDQVAQRAELDPSALPYNEELLAYLRQQHATGRRIVLATGANHRIASCIAAHLGIFNQVIAGDDHSCMTGRQKCERLQQEFAVGGFDYAGNSDVDLTVWKAARKAVVVNCSRSVAERARSANNVEREFDDRPPTLRTWLRALRIHQWSKNLIVFLPVIASHQIFVAEVVARAVLMFACFCMMASGTYMLNDLLDMAVDRQHTLKKHRPFAAGDLDIRWGIVLVPVLTVAALALALLLPAGATALLTVYFVTTLAYSFRLKRVMLIDVFVLASLYTIRLVAGHAATGVRYSH